MLKCVFQKREIRESERGGVETETDLEHVILCGATAISTDRRSTNTD